jgi:ligand-binding sensor domain-containing protein/serine phosphatase RsbU (regulator of sigma subunit)
MKRAFLLVFAIYLLANAPEVTGQTPFLRQHHLFRGKEEYNIKVIYQDPKGWIWFGTDRGLFRFDGINYSRFTISEGLVDDQITALNSTTDGELWIGHKNGKVTIYDGNKFTRFTPEESLGNVEITDIVSDSTGVVWYSTLGEGLYKYDGRYLTNLDTDDGISDNYIYDIEIDLKGTLWLATDNGITHFLNDKMEIISMKDGLNDNIVRALKPSVDGRVWIGTEEKGMSVYDPGNRAITQIEGWNFGAITGFTINFENDIWISTEKQGIIQLKFTAENKPTYRKLTVQQGLISDRTNTIIRDREENIWIGGKQGVIQALPPAFEFLNKTNGTPFEMIYNFTKDKKNNLWVCSEAGLFRGTPDNTGKYYWSNISEKLNSPKVNFISLFLDKNGEIWAGTYGEGVYKINPGNLTYSKISVTEGLNDNNVISISGNDSLIWFSTLGGGISCYNLYLSHFIRLEQPGLANSYIYATKSDKSGRVWIAGSLRYPAFIDKGSLYLITNEGMRFTQLYSVAIDSSDGVWFNTGDKGIIKVTGDSLILLGKNEGIGYDQIQSIIFDKLNNLLVISNRGFLFYKPSTGVLLEFGENSGLSYLYPILNSVYADPDGQIWIGTETGIIKYNPDYLKFIGQNPRVFLSTKNLFYNPIQTGRTKFRYSENNFTFGYTGIWFSNPEGLTYRYILEGYDLEWIFSNRNLTLTYSQLPPGNYTFKVEVSLDGKTWYSSQDSSYYFRVRPPFWQRWWFLAAVSLLILSGIYLYTKKRVASLEKAKKELEEEVQRRTEEVTNKNRELEIQKAEISIQRDLAEEQRDKIEAQKEDIQSSIRYAHRIQSAVLPPKKQLDSVLKEYFILNKPKDIVSGDFYWIAQNPDCIFFSVGDCTGHGVPGSFMSILGISILNDIVKTLRIFKASTILDMLKERIHEALHQDTEREVITYDGIDIGLCILDPHSKILQFAAAHNPMYLIRNGVIINYLADEIDIGRFSNEKTEFTNHIIQCETGDQIYLFSDGYIDQFGGPLRKKYKSQKFRDFLLSIHTESMENQRELLNEEIENWRGKLAQLDDILVIGVKI